MGRYKTKLQAIQEANKRILKEETDPYADKKYDADSDEWVVKDVEDKYLSGPYDKEYIEGIINAGGVVNKVEEMKEALEDILNNIDVLEDYKRKEIEDDLYSLDHKLAVLWEKIIRLRLPRE